MNVAQFAVKVATNDFKLSRKVTAGYKRQLYTFIATLCVQSFRCLALHTLTFFTRDTTENSHVGIDTSGYSNTT